LPTFECGAPPQGATVGRAPGQWWELYQKDGDTTVAGRCRNLWDEYLAFTGKIATPPIRRYQQVHYGHCAFLPDEERRFITGSDTLDRRAGRDA
jgi:hypothetical protein